ncbi:MAG TPA: hypothetical protein VGD08_15010, partial [Stellaceae bacterium]
HRNVILTRIDPVRLKAALGVLPAVTEVTVERKANDAADAAPGFVFRRAAENTAAAQQVLYRLAPPAGADGGAAAQQQQQPEERYGTITIPPGAASVSVTLRDLLADRPDLQGSALHGALSVVPNGNDYTVGGHDAAVF